MPGNPKNVNPKEKLNMDQRFRRWQEVYPHSTWVWQEWHKYLICSGKPEDIQKADLINLDDIFTDKESLAAQMLFNFEDKKEIGKLPVSCGISISLLKNITYLAFERLNGFWNNLSGHYEKHCLNNPEELKIFRLVAVCLRDWAISTGLQFEGVDDIFVGDVYDERTYGLLAVAVLIMIRFHPQLVKDFEFYLYCSGAPNKLSLGLMIYISPKWIYDFSGQPVKSSLILGLTFARIDKVSDTLVVPRLLQEYFVSTFFASSSLFNQKFKFPGYISRISWE